MAYSICDFKQTGFKGIRRRIWVSGIFVSSFCNFGFFFFLFFSFDSFAGLVEQCALKRLGEGESLSSCKHTLAAASAFAAAALASV
jgi:hypothetical protein